MKMQQVPAYDLNAGAAFKLEPGGNHIMLLGLAKQLKVGDTFTITLRLASGASIDSKVEVRQMPASTPTMPPAGGGMR